MASLPPPLLPRCRSWFVLEQDIDLRIQGRSESGQSIDIRESTTVASDQTQIVRIRIGDLGQGSYTLNVKGRSPIEFEQSQKLEYVHKGYSIFIQTDKAIYRPGDLFIKLSLGDWDSNVSKESVEKREIFCF